MSAPRSRDPQDPGTEKEAANAEEARAAVAPGREYAPIEGVANEKLEPRDMLPFITAAVEHEGLVGHNIQGYNQFLEQGLSQIMTSLFDVTREIPNERAQTPADAAIRSYQVRLNFHGVRVDLPTYPMYYTGRIAPLTPARARLTGLPYSGPTIMGATATVVAQYGDGRVEERTADVPPFQISSFPIMVGSSRCHTHNCTRAAKIELGEDPNDPGGYFIAKRGEYVVDLLENILYNEVHLHRKQKQGELVRAEFLSQPGGAFENSSQIRVRLMASGQITLEVTSTKFEGVRLPFFVLYRLFGMTSDRAIAETIVLDVEDRSPVTLQALDILERAFQLAEPAFAPLIGELDHARVVEHTAAQLARHLTVPATADAALQFLNTDLLSGANRKGGLDAMILPHMGQTPESRQRKLRLLGRIIDKLLRVHLGYAPPTDRDSLRTKRVHGAGVSLAKAFKTQVNNSVVILILKAFRRELKNNPWREFTEKAIADTFRNALGTSDLNRAMEQAITAGNKTIVVRRRVATNRVSSQALERKNPLNTVSALRTVVTQNAGNAAKQTKRAEEMRQVHPSYPGYICLAQSADTGENVGMRKQLAITAGVCTAGDAVPLRRHLLADPAVVPLDRVGGPEILRRGLAGVYVNGEWLGATASAPALAERYRRLRREGRVVGPTATIYWDPVFNEVKFWLDVGRLRRPLLIVDNNLPAHDAALLARHRGEAAPPVEFVQNVRYTPAHAAGLQAGRLGLADLLAEGVAEYVTPEEQENCLVAPSLAALRAARHDVTRRYTHCEVEQAVYGLAALLAPFANHTQPARVTYETNQGRQTGGWYAMNFPWRTDKNRFFQFYNEVPLVSTLTHRFVPSNGSNVTVAYASYLGDNMEDSAIVNQASVDRGLFAGAFFRFELLELEKGEEFRNPDPLSTKNLKPGACYEKLVDGFVRVGAVVSYGDVLIGRVARLARGREGDGEYAFTDRSLVYKGQEPAVVEDTLRPRGANGEYFGLVKLRFERPLRTGDKLSSRSGNKSITALLLPPSDMPFTEDGITPDIIINPHSFPTRMIVGQLIEAAASVSARRGSLYDGTAFLPVDHDALFADMAALGMRYNGRHRMYNGLTGEYFDAAIVMGPCHEQRLQKFVLDDEQAVAGSGPTDATTGQPLGGKHVQGGLRLGEMEFWCLFAHGAMLNVAEKLGDSDARPQYVCRGCGNPAVYHAYYGLYECRHCGEAADIAVVDSSKTAMLTQEELNSSGIRVVLGLANRTFEAGALPL